MAGLAGTTLALRGGYVTNEVASGVPEFEWDDETCTSTKFLPKDVQGFMVEAWNEPGKNRFDHFDPKTGKARPIHPDLETWLTEKGCLGVFQALIESFRAEGDKLTAKRCGELCSECGLRFEECGVRLHLCRTTVNKGETHSKDFLWLELVGRSKVDAGYVPNSAWVSSGREDAAATDNPIGNLQSACSLQ